MIDDLDPGYHGHEVPSKNNTPTDIAYSPRHPELEEAFRELQARIKAKPHSYIMSQEEFAILSVFMDRVEGDEIAEHALARYWATGGDSPTRGMFTTTPELPFYYTRIPGECPDDHLRQDKRRSVRPSDFLGLEVDDIGVSPAPGPSTPLPGTAQGFDFDGANDSTELFERSVEYKDKKYKKENRKLKKMVSLDAMAEECANTPPCEPELQDHSNKRRQSTLTTVDSVPEDMAELTRQKAHLQTPSAGHRDPMTGEWQSDDPFAPGNVVGDIAEKGPPSPTKSVQLPLRPKITVQDPESVEPPTMMFAGTGSFANIIAAATKDAAQDSPFTLIDTEERESGEYNDYKAQHHLPDLSEKEDPDYYSPTRSVRSDSAVNVIKDIQGDDSFAGLVPCVPVFATSAPDSHPSEDDAFDDAFGCPYKFNSWQETPSAVPSSQNNSPATSNSNRSPNMGERELFELKRSLRNMRYNALGCDFGSEDHDDDAKPPSAFPSPLRPRLCLNTGDLKPGRRTSPKKNLRHDDVGLSSDSVDAELKDMVAQHYHFKDHIDSLAPEDAASTSGGLVLPTEASTENPFSPASEAYSSHLSPNSKKIWAQIQRGPFDTPPTAGSPSSQHQREGQMVSDDDLEEGEICEYDFESPAGTKEEVIEGESSPAKEVALTDSLDECLEMFRSFNQMPTEGGEEAIASPDSGYVAERESESTNGGGSASGSPGKKKPLPARYRSIRGTMREGEA